MDLANRQKFIAELKKEYLESFEKLTPEKIKKNPLADISDKGEIKLIITREMVEQHKLDEWFAAYKKEAQNSTGGIRGPQNILYCWDTRFPLNQLGLILATVAKGLVLKEENPGKEINKIVSGEVRYNTDLYVELIARLEAALGINVHLPKGVSRTTIWMTSFLIFMNDYDGGEYVSSSHAMSSKTATKDLESQGGQFLPEMSLKFVNKIEEILNYVKSHPGGYVVTIAPADSMFIKKDFDGFELYADYLRKIVATPANLDLLKQAASRGFRLMFDTVGGCMYQNMVPIFKALRMSDIFDWHNSPEDPFFHGVGKTRMLNPKTGQEGFFDLSCDVSLPEVSRTMGYEIFLKDKPVGYTVLITDPDGDRLLIGQVEPSSAAGKLQNLGIDYLKIDEEKIVSIYHPAFTFLLVMDFQMRQLKAAGLWNNHPRFIITTTPSPRSWDEWAAKNNIKVVNTPVGIKEIASVMKKIEGKMQSSPQGEVLIEDVWGNKVNLGAQPRMVFGGEESGGMIMGPEDLVKSKGGREAMAMRDKSAGEASIIAAALAAWLHLQKKSISEHLEDVFNEYDIRYRYYLRADITYYNESEPDPAKLKIAKEEGMKLRDEIDTFCLGLALSKKEVRLTLEQAREILGEAMPSLNFSELEDIRFTGDATYFAFRHMYVQIRRSGTDAKLRGYANGDDKAKCQKYLDIMVHYSGAKTPAYRKYISEEFIKNIYPQQKELYRNYLYKDLI